MPHCQGLSSDPSVPLFWGVGFMMSCSRSAFWQRSWAPQTSVGGGFRRHRVAAPTVQGAVDSLPAVFYRVPVRLEPQTRLFGI